MGAAEKRCVLICVLHPSRTSVDASSGDMSPVPSRSSTACSWTGSSPVSSSGPTKAANPGFKKEKIQ